MAPEPLVQFGNLPEHQVQRQQQIYGQLLDGLSQEARRASRMAGSPSRYSNVHALLIQWEHDDLGVAPEVQALATVFRQDFGFQVENYMIPVNKSFQQLNRTLLDWTDCHDHDETLLIVYYAGHGVISDLGRTLIWKNRYHRDNEYYSDLKWNGCEEIVQQAAADKLFIFDCCYAASALSIGPFNGASETLCASGFEAIAPVPGPHSFTTALVFVLRGMARCQHPFSVATLHSAVLAYLQALDPNQVSWDGRRLANARDHVAVGHDIPRREHRISPVYFVRSNHHGYQPPAIHIFPLAQPPGFTVLHEEPQRAVPGQTDPHSSTAIDIGIDLESGLTERDPLAARHWLRSLPLRVERIRINTTARGRGAIPTAFDEPQKSRTPRKGRKNMMWPFGAKTFVKEGVLHINMGVDQGILFSFCMCLYTLYFLPDFFFGLLLGWMLFAVIFLLYRGAELGVDFVLVYSKRTSQKPKQA